MVAPDNALEAGVPPIVLLVDQHSETLTTHSACFEAAGLWVATSSDPDEALDAIRELKPDLLITDHFARDGVNLVHTVRTAVEAPFPIILLSSRPLTGVPLVTRTKADLCLEKPISPEKLVDSGRTLLQRWRSQRGRHSAPLAPSAVPAIAAVNAVGPEVNASRRVCPTCGRSLEWIERGRLYGMEYDYYRWCLTGCGLFCYDRQGATWVKLA